MKRREGETADHYRRLFAKKYRYTAEGDMRIPPPPPCFVIPLTSHQPLPLLLTAMPCFETTWVRSFCRQ